MTSSISKLRALKRRDALYRVTDSAGLVVEVPVNGAPRWRFRYRFDGKAKMLSFGTYPSFLSRRRVCVVMRHVHHLRMELIRAPAVRKQNANVRLH